MPAPLTPAESIVYAALVAAAEAGARSPKNWELAALLGCKPNTASLIVTRLAARGWIAVRRGAVSRVITIAATGKSTAGEVGTPHWRLRDAVAGEVAVKAERRRIARLTGTVRTPVPSAVAAVVAPEPEPVVTDRDPCFRCGARGDVCCGHRRMVTT